MYGQLYRRRGVRHTVEVHATTVLEAAAAGVKTIRDTGVLDDDGAFDITVEICTTTRHQVSWPRVQAWLDSSSRKVAFASPRLYARLAYVDRDLQLTGLRHRENTARMLGRLSPDGSDVLRPLTDAVEPVKYYGRLLARMRNPGAAPPALNHVVDALPPESMGAVAFRRTVRQFLAAPDDTAEHAIRKQLTQWRDNHALLAALAPRSFAMHEIAPVSEDLSVLSSAALEAMDYRAQWKAPPPGWSSKARAVMAKQKVSRRILAICSPRFSPRYFRQGKW